MLREYVDVDALDFKVKKGRPKRERDWVRDRDRLIAGAVMLLCDYYGFSLYRHQPSKKKLGGRRSEPRAHSACSIVSNALRELGMGRSEAAVIAIAKRYTEVVDGRRLLKVDWFDGDVILPDH
jgi:hypothetical protein